MGERGGSDRSGSGPGLALAAARGRSPVRDAVPARRSMRDAASAWQQAGAREFILPPPPNPRGSTGAAENPPPWLQGYPAPEFVLPPAPAPRGSTGAAENPPPWRHGYWRLAYPEPWMFQLPPGWLFKVPAAYQMPSGAACQMPPLPYSPYSNSSIPPPGPPAPGPVRPIAAAPTYGSAGGDGAAAPVAINGEGRRLPLWKVAIWSLSDDTTPKSLQNEIGDIDFTADCIATCPGMRGALLLWFTHKYEANGFVACFDGTTELKHNGTKLRAAPLHIEKCLWDVPEQISTFAAHAPDWLCPSCPDSWFEGHFVGGEIEWTQHQRLPNTAG